MSALTTAPFEIECGSEEEIALRGLWLSRVMFGRYLTPELAFAENRSYEAWLHDAGYVLT